MCKDDEERNTWLHVIRQARVGRSSKSKAWFSQQVFHGVQTLMREATTVPTITHILTVIQGIPLRLPVHFIQSLVEKRRGPARDICLKQALADLERETVELDHISIQQVLGSSDDHQVSSRVLFLLMESIRRKDDRIPTWELLQFVRNVVRHTYRTQTGGDCFFALQKMLSLDENRLIRIQQKTIKSSENPICIQVTDTIPDVNDVGGDGGTIGCNETKISCSGILLRLIVRSD